MATQQHDDLFLFLKENAIQLKLNNTAAIQNRYNKLKQRNINYEDLLTCNGSDLRNKLKETELKPSQQSGIIELLKNINDLDDITSKMDKKIVDGYLRIKDMKKEKIDIPNDIINLIFLFYHIIIRECFKHYRKGSYKLNNIFLGDHEKIRNFS